MMKILLESIYMQINASVQSGVGRSCSDTGCMVSDSESVGVCPDLMTRVSQGSIESIERQGR